MKIAILPDQTIQLVQQAFQKSFPFLKIEFFTRAHGEGRPSEAKFLVPIHRRIGDYMKVNAPQELAFDAQTKVMDLEKMFQLQCGLFVQVFRKSGRVWLETTITDDWTLEKQNQQGMELEGSEREKPEPPDYQEMD
jgi:hypothetical protein